MHATSRSFLEYAMRPATKVLPLPLVMFLLLRSIQLGQSAILRILRIAYQNNNSFSVLYTMRQLCVFFREPLTTLMGKITFT